MILFEKKYLEKKEYVDCLKGFIDDALNDDMLKIIREAKELVKDVKSAMYDSTSDDYEKEYGVSINDILLAFQFNVFYLECMYPLFFAMDYLRLTDLENLIRDRSWKELIDQPLDDVPDWNYVFDILSIMPSRISKYYIAQLVCSNEQQFTLVKALTEKDSESFVSCIFKLGKESWQLKHVADLYNIAFSIRSIGELIKNAGSYSQVSNVLEFLDIIRPSFLPKDLMDANLKNEGLYKWFSNNRLPNRDSLAASQIENLKWENMESVYRHFMGTYLGECEIFRLEKNSIYPEIQEILSKYIIDPEKIEFYQELKKRGVSINITIEGEDSSTDNTETKETNLSGKDVFLPNDFFKIQNRRKVDKAIGVIASKYVEGIENPVPKFCELINFLAERKYIKNDIVLKKDFASKLTGYYPEYNKMEKLDWFGDTNVLSVLIQNLPLSQNKWERAKKIFNLEKILYNNSTLRKNNPEDQDFAEKFKDLYGVDLR